MLTYSRMLPGAASPGILMRQDWSEKYTNLLCLIKWEILLQLIVGRLHGFTDSVQLSFGFGLKNPRQFLEITVSSNTTLYLHPFRELVYAYKEFLRNN